MKYFFFVIFSIIFFSPILGKTVIEYNSLPRINACEGKITLALVRTWGGDETGDENQFFRFPMDIITDPENGRIFITDSENHRIQVFETNGRFIRSIGRKGQGPNDLLSPLSASFDNQHNLIVCDSGNNRFQVFNTDGKSLKIFKYKNQIPLKLFINGQDEIVFSSTNHNSPHLLFVLNSKGEWIKEIGNYHKKIQPEREGIFFTLGKDGSIITLYFATPYFKKYNADGSVIYNATYEIFPGIPPIKWDESRDAPRQVEEYKTQLSAGLAVDSGNRIYIVATTRPKQKSEIFFLTDPGVKYPRNAESTKTDRFRLLVFSHAGKIIAAKKLDVFCDNIYVCGDRLFIIDTYMGQMIHEYKISFN